MISVSLVSLLIQLYRNLKTSTTSISCTTDVCVDMQGNFNHLFGPIPMESMDQDTIFTGNDIPFHLVMRLSCELSAATRNYLEKIDCHQVPAYKLPA